MYSITEKPLKELNSNHQIGYWALGSTCQTIQVGELLWGNSNVERGLVARAAHVAAHERPARATKGPVAPEAREHKRAQAHKRPSQQRRPRAQRLLARTHAFVVHELVHRGRRRHGRGPSAPAARAVSPATTFSDVRDSCGARSSVRTCSQDAAVERTHARQIGHVVDDARAAVRRFCARAHPVEARVVHKVCACRLPVYD